MNDSCHLFILDLNRPITPPPLTVKKGDTGRTLQFMLVTSSTPYVISSDCYAVFTAKKPDGSILYNTCEIHDSMIFYTFTAQTCAVTGKIPCEIKLYGPGDKLITSSTFLLVVEDTVYSDGDIIESVSEVSALTDLISDATKLITDIENKLAENAYADAHSAVCYTSQDLTDAQKTQARDNIAAAPTGYGLGTSARGMITSISELNTITHNGWYNFFCTATTLNNIIFNYASVFVMNCGIGSYIVQELRPINTNTVLRRYRDADGVTWSSWECENPPFTAGVEYRTTERWRGKAVYVQLVDLGTLPSSGTSYVQIAAGIGDYNFIDLSLNIKGSDTQNVNGLSSLRDACNIRFFNNGYNWFIAITVSENLSAYTATAIAKYIPA